MAKTRVRHINCKCCGEAEAIPVFRPQYLCNLCMIGIATKDEEKMIDPRVIKIITKKVDEWKSMHRECCTYCQMGKACEFREGMDYCQNQIEMLGDEIKEPESIGDQVTGG